MRTKVLKGCVPRTLHRYRRAAESVLRSLHRRHRPVVPSRWTLNDALWIKERLHAEHWSLTVIADFARSFGNDVIRRAGIPSRPAPIHVRWLSRSEVESVVSSTHSDPLLGFVAFLGLGMGLRRVEWQRMRTEDVDLSGQRLLVRGKGRGHPKLQWLPLHPSFADVYHRFSAYRENLIQTARYLHPDLSLPPEALIHSSPNGLSAYSLSGLDLLVKRIERRMLEVGCRVRLASHMFRRSGATLLEETLLKSPSTAPDGVYRVLQGFLRHENLATTMRYLESNPGRQQRALVRFAEAVPWTTTPAVPPASRGARLAVEGAKSTPVSNGENKLTRSAPRVRPRPARP
jgi:integrase